VARVSGRDRQLRHGRGTLRRVPDGRQAHDRPVVLPVPPHEMLRRRRRPVRVSAAPAAAADAARGAARPAADAVLLAAHPAASVSAAAAAAVDRPRSLRRAREYTPRSHGTGTARKRGGGG